MLMERQHHTKCASICHQHSSHHPAQFSNAHHHHYGQLPQVPRRLTSETIHNNRNLPNIPSINNIGHTDVGASFLSHLSGPIAQSCTDLQHSLNPVPIPCRDSLNYRTINDSSKERILSLLHSVLWPQKMDNQYIKYGEVVCPITSQNSTASVSHLNSSKLVQSANLNVERAKLAVACQNPHVHDNAETFSSLNRSSMFSSHSDITASEKVHLECKFPASSPVCNPSGSFPRVFCSGISGNLLLSDSGILGVVCSCHGVYMSIANFSEHSGLYNVNPGNVIRMDNGESLAQWRSMFFTKHGIRVLEGYQGWDWSEGNSAPSPSGLRNHRVTSASDSAVHLTHVAPIRTSVWYGQQPHGAPNSKDPRSCSSFPAGFPCLETEKPSQAHSDVLLKDFMSSFRGNLQHVADEQTVQMLNSVGRGSTVRASHLAKAENLVCHPDTQNLQANSCSLFEVLGVSSNAELRLRQPPGRTTLGTKVLPAFRSDLDPQKVFTDHLRPKSSKPMEMREMKSTAQVVDAASSERRRPSQSDRSNLISGPYDATIDLPTYSLNQDVPLTVLNPLLTFISSPQLKQQLTTADYAANESHAVAGKIHGESHADESARVFFPQSRLAGNLREYSANLPNAHKEVEIAVSGLLHTAKLSYRDSIRTSSSTYSGEDRILLGFSSGNSAFVPCTAKEKDSEIRPALHSCNLKVPDMAGQSTRNHCPASENNRVQHQIQHSPDHHAMQALITSKRDRATQELPYPHMPEKGSYADHSNFTAEKNKIDPNTTCEVVNAGDGTASEMATSVSHSNENCVLSTTKAKPSDTTGNLASQNTKRVESHYFQWRNVPRSRAGSCTSRQDQLAGSCNDEGNLNSATYAAKCSTTSSVVKSMREHEMSNASSRCAAPEVIQPSIEINMKDSSAVDPRDMRCAEVLDKGSRSYGSFPLTDALDSASQTNLSRSSELASRKRCRSLIEELRLQNLLMSKDARYQIQKNSIQEYDDQAELGSIKRIKTVVSKKCDPPFSMSVQSAVSNESSKCTKEVGQNSNSVISEMHQGSGLAECEHILRNCASSVDQKKKNSALSGSKKITRERDLQSIHYQVQADETEKNGGFADDILAASGMLRMKRLRVNGTSSTSKQIQHNCGSNDASTSRFTSLDGPCGKLFNSDKRIVRPIVFGKYGIISNGNPLRPEKILPLRQILKKMAHHTKTSDHSNKKLKSASVRMKTMSVRHVMETSTNNKVLNGQAKPGKTRGLMSIEFTTHDSSAEMPIFSGTTDSKCLSYALGKRSEKCNKNHGSQPRDQLNKMFKTRKHKCHELRLRGKEPEIVNSPIMRNSRSLCLTGSKNQNAIDCRCKTNEMSNHIRCTARRQVAKRDASFCDCGGPDKDSSDHLLECSRILIKELLRGEVEAVDLDNATSYRRTINHATTQCVGDNNSEILRAEGNLTCARTEGYKGRTWDNHPQESNGNSDCLVSQEQLNAWQHIQRTKPHRKGRPKLPSININSDLRKAYARYKQSKGWTHLVVYKSSIHALGLYTSQFICRGAMVVEYVGEMVGLRVADKREREYHSGKRLLHKSACYFFRVDKEHIIDATRKGGIARFVNHSCVPNCVAKVILMRSEKKVIFVAERDIYPGEEITYDYQFNHEDEGEKIPCYCRSNKCRRYLN